MKALGFNVQYHRMPKYLGSYKTIAPSLVRVFYRGKWVLDVPMPKYGRE